MRKILCPILFFVGASSFAQSTHGNLGLNDYKADINNNNVFFRHPVMQRTGYRATFPVATISRGVILSSSFWFAGKDADDSLYFSGSLNSVSDFSPGPFSSNDSYGNQSYQNLYGGGVWNITKEQIEAHKNLYNQPGYTPIAVIQQWPAKGNDALGVAHDLAPFVDLNGDGVYDPYDGDYPCVPGNVASYVILNDGATASNNSGGQSMGVELHQLFYQFNSTSSTNFNRGSTFINLRVVNRGAKSFPNCRMGLYTDFGIGNPNNDFMGCSPQHNMMFGYNGSNDDPSVEGGGALGYLSNPPACGIKALNSVMHVHGLSPGILPNIETIWNLMNALNEDGSPFLAPVGPPPYDTNTEYAPTNLLYDGNPFTGVGYSEVSAENEPGNRKSFMVFNNQSFNANDSRYFDFVVLVAESGNYLSNVNFLFQHAQAAQTFYNNTLFNENCLISSVNLDKNEQAEVLLFPNPTQNHFFIQFQNMQPDFVRVYSMTGVLVHEQMVSGGENLLRIETGNLSSGVYVVQVGEVIRRVIID